jgi:hypothetical protein
LYNHASEIVRFFIASLLGLVLGVFMADYRIEPDGTLVVLLSERATQRGVGPRPQQGARLAFKTRNDTAEFVQAGESQGFTFEGKEFVAGI